MCGNKHMGQIGISYMVILTSITTHMKSLIKITFIALFALLAIPQTTVQAQSGVKIDLQKFNLVLTDVNALYIRPVGAPFKDSTGTIQQKVYYELVRENGKLAERGNWDLPATIYAHINSYVMGTVDETTTNTINAFFEAADLPELVAVLPEETEQEE
jgi:hypothetical protein